MRLASRQGDQAGSQTSRRRGRQKTSEAGHLPHDAAVTRVGHAHRENGREREEKSRAGTGYQVPGLVSSAHCVRVNCLEAAAAMWNEHSELDLQQCSARHKLIR